MINLVVFEGCDVVYVDKVDGICSVWLFFEVGCVIFVYMFGVGKVIFVWCSYEDVVVLLGGILLLCLMVCMLTLFDAFEDDFKWVCRCGFVIDNEEYEEGVVCVGMLVFDYCGILIVVFLIFGLMMCIFNVDIVDFGVLLCEYVEVVFTKFGYIG